MEKLVIGLQVALPNGTIVLPNAKQQVEIEGFINKTLLGVAVKGNMAVRRKYVRRKGKRQSWSEAEVRAAVEKYNRGLTSRMVIRQLAQEFGTKRSTAGLFMAFRRAKIDLGLHVEKHHTSRYGVVVDGGEAVK